jgi:hypothetical protein
MRIEAMRIFVPLVFFWAILFARNAEAHPCTEAPNDPSDAVFAIVKSKDPEQKEFERNGTAFLVDSERMLLLTVGHIQSSGASAERLFVEKDHVRLPFEVVAQGTILEASGDWALIKVIFPDGNDYESWRLIQDLHVVYDRASLADLSHATILGKSDLAFNVSISNENPVDACSKTHAILVQVDGYEKGHSGSPVFSKELGGVVGITSRFDKLPKINKNECLSFFNSVARALSDTERGKLRVDALSCFEQIQFLADLVAKKDRHFVQITPIKCVVDELIQGVWSRNRVNRGARKLIREQLADRIKLILRGIEAYVREDDDNSMQVLFRRLSESMEHESADWIDVIQLEDGFTLQRKKFSADNVKDLLTKMDVIRSAINLVEKKMGYTNIVWLYGRLLERNARMMEESQSSPSDITEEFIKENAGISESNAQSFSTVRIDKTLNSSLGVAKQIELGSRLTRLSESLAEKSSEVSEKVRKMFADLGAAYLVSAMREIQSGAPVSEESRIQIIGDLARAVAISAVRSDEPKTKEAGKKLSGTLAAAYLADQSTAIETIRDLSMPELRRVQSTLAVSAASENKSAIEVLGANWTAYSSSVSGYASKLGEQAIRSFNLR